MAAVKISYSLPQIIEPGHRDPYWPTFALARVADELGFDTGTIGQHHFIPGNISDPLMFLGAVAVKTERLRVGTGIYLLAVHDPVRAAEQVALLDQLSGGRAVLGVGTGWNPLEFEVFGSDIHRRGARLDEGLRLLRHLWTTEDEGWEGTFFRVPPLTLYPRPIQQPHPPLWVAGVAPAAVERAARLGDAWICGPVQSLGQARSCLATYRSACDREGKSPDWILRRYAWIGTDHRHLAEQVLPAYVDQLLAHWRESVEGDEERELLERIDGGEKVSAEEVAADRLLWGTPDQFLSQIERYRSETGVEHLHVAFGAGLPGSSVTGFRGTYPEHLEMLTLFGREVLPALS
jgi:probable F420-dependent oxidoreductase